MEKITATRSLTVSSERSSWSFGRCCDVSRTEFATKSDPLETGGSNCELDLSTIGTQSGMVLQMVEPVSSGGSQRAAQSLACAAKQSTLLVERNTSGDPGYSRSADATSWTARTISTGRSSDNSSRA